ncbi:glycine-rich protein [Peribacillus glennii]|uniref:receptor protein-tyrosine kinase n=1 Tax=Peribacillus glennii TaxID=2303991 RepID=A0A372L7H0_9BACI|nr:glycine-rich protein [Peribacillus glennii]RFU61208.1 hypothetical protein D0466_18490 [Peribacillus glennii]
MAIQWLHKQKNGLKRNSNMFFKKTLSCLVLSAGVLLGIIPVIGNSSVYAESNSWDFQYTGAVQEYTAPYTGTYKLEVWGAQGGSHYLPWRYQPGGYGGYAKGDIRLTAGETLYVYVGEEGSKSGGWNGGGNGGSEDESGMGGGGGTDIRLISATSPTDPVSLNSRIIVAGGGGGHDDTQDWYAGWGGGESGGAVFETAAGTQTSGYAFGYGQNGSSSTAGGGGGWYGGYAGVRTEFHRVECGAGGSGYVLTSSSYKPEGYSVNPSYYLTNTQLIAGNEPMPSTSGGRQYGQSGNGYAKITLKTLADTTPPVTTDDAPKDWVNNDVTVNLTATDKDGSGVANTYYKLDNDDEQSGTSVKVSTQGIHTITYWSVDKEGNIEDKHTATVKIDNSAPVTTLSADPGTPNGKNGWYTSDVQVSLSAKDSDGSGAANTEYRLNGGEWTPYNGAFTLSDDGTHVIDYRSTDNAGNTEQFNTKTIKLDKTPPTLNIRLDKTSIWPPNGKMVPVTAIINASDATSGMDSVVLASITSNERLRSDDIQNAKYHTPITRSTDTFKLLADRLGKGKGRVYTITFRATDKAGNVTNKSVTVTVPHNKSNK